MRISNIKGLILNKREIIIKLAAVFYLISCFTLQFYVFSSGTLQPSQFFLIFSFFLTFFFIPIDFKILKNKSFFCFTIFLVLTFLINLTYSIFYQSVDFVLSSFYYLFGIIYSYLTILFLKNLKILNKYLIYVLILSLVILIILWAIGLGDYKFFPRYNGYFNDPNQMAHWALCIVASIILLNRGKLFINPYVFVIGTIIVLVSLSRSGFLGLTLIGLGVFIQMKKTILIFLLIIFSFILSIITIENDNAVLSSYDNITNRLLETDFEEQADTRGYSRVKNYPIYLLFGSGQGFDNRFNSDYEIHSSWVGIFFYYGFFPTMIFLIALFTNFKHLNLSNKLIISGPLIYGFSTFGIRTPVFWLFTGVLIFITQDHNKIKKVYV